MTVDARPADLKVSAQSVLAPLFLEHHNPPLILDVRDPEEVIKGKGGPPSSLSGSISVPLNHDGIGQRERLTTLDEFLAKLRDVGVTLPSNKQAVIITHCGTGGRGGKAAALLQHAGYMNVHNGGGLAYCYCYARKRQTERQRMKEC